MKLAEAVGIVVVDDEPPIRSLLAAFIGRTAGLRWLAGCGSAAEALRVVPRLRPGVVVMDIQLPDLSGIEAVRQLRPLCPPAAILMLSARVDGQAVRDSLAAGASGYCSKQYGLDRVPRAVLELHAHGSFLCPEASSRLVEFYRGLARQAEPPGALTPRELEVLSLVAEGMGDKAIADALGISIPTVHTHVGNILLKLEVSNRAAAVAKHFLAAFLRREP